MLHIGHVAKSHGTSGYFSIKLSIPVDLCHLCKDIETIYLEDQSKPLNIINSILNNKIFLKTKVENINSREDAKLILRKNIYIKKSENVNIDEAIDQKNKFLNFQVLDKKLGKIGVVNKIDFNRPQTILFVKSDEKTILIPYVKELITNVNNSKKEIELDLPEGIIDICSE
tara:strand:+ start:80 stop:592 length:513 start_codon:yes stop_codon:yes gene_type:complete